MTKGTGSFEVYCVVPFTNSGAIADLEARIKGGFTAFRAKDLVDVWVDSVKLGTGAQTSGAIAAGGNGIPDWIDVHVKDIHSSLKGELATVVGKIAKYTDKGAPAAAMMSVPRVKSDTALVRINPSSANLRPKKNYTPVFESRAFNQTKDPFVNAYWHEGRHGYQNHLVNKPGNDAEPPKPEGDWLPKALKAGVSFPKFKYPEPNSAKQRTLQDEDNEKKLPYTRTDLKATVQLVYSKTTSQGDLFLTKEYVLPDGSRYNLPINADGLKLTIRVKGQMKPLTLTPNKKYYLSGIDHHTGKIRVTYNKNEVDLDPKGHPIMAMTYSYPTKNDAQSVRELDAYTWTQDREAAKK